MGQAEKVYDETAAGYDMRSRNPYTGMLRAAESRFLKRHARGMILDAGCGTGYHLRSLDNAVGVDISKEMLRIAEKTGRPVRRGNLEELPFGDGKFDTVLCLYSVLNVCEWGKAVSELCRVARPRGKVIVSVSSIYDKGYRGIGEKRAVRPDRYTQAKKIHIEGKNLHMHLFTKEELVREFAEHGFMLEEFDSLFRGVMPRWGLWKRFSVKERAGLMLDGFRGKVYGSMYLMVFKKGL